MKDELSEQIEKAASLIREGKLVAFPTETVYGLGANALDPMAVARIFDLKERPSFDPLIVHIADISVLRRLCVLQDDRAEILASRFWPGPLTMVLEKKSIVPDIVSAGLSTVGVRMPDHPVALELILRSGCPIAAPSANKFGEVSPTHADHVKRNLPGVDMVLDGGGTSVGIESTIIKLTDNGFVLLRPGAILPEDIAIYVPQDHSYYLDGVDAPGMMKSHYSTRKPLFLETPGICQKMDCSNAGYLSFDSVPSDPYKKVLRLTKNGDAREYAVNLFAGMHELDRADVAFIVAEPVPEVGIGVAIMDRLRKAAYRHDNSSL